MFDLLCFAPLFVKILFFYLAVLQKNKDTQITDHKFDDFCKQLKVGLKLKSGLYFAGGFLSKKILIFNGCTINHHQDYNLIRRFLSLKS